MYCKSSTRHSLALTGQLVCMLNSHISKCSWDAITMVKTYDENNVTFESLMTWNKRVVPEELVCSFPDTNSRYSRSQVQIAKLSPYDLTEVADFIFFPILVLLTVEEGDSKMLRYL